VAGSLAVDALLVAAGTALFPSTRGYAHFRSTDYGALTVVGVVAASLAWPVTARISSAPRRLFRRVAVVVTLVLWLPDLWILAEGQPPRAVAVLMVMHLAIAVVTYNVLVRLAPVGSPEEAADQSRQAPPVPGPSPDVRRTGPGLSSPGTRRAGMAMGGLVASELALGIGTLVVVPYDRSSTWLPARGQLVYLAHAALGGVLGLGAVALLLVTRRARRVDRIGGTVGCIGVLVAAGGGVASVDHATRLVGVGLMLAGTVVAGFGYLMLTMEVTPPDEPRDPAPTTVEG